MSHEHVKKATQNYSLNTWGDGYFAVSEQGEVECRPTADNKAISLTTVVKKAQEKGANLPLLVRFPQILQHRIQSLHQAFEAAIKQYRYQGQYTSVYPIKVNQERQVVLAMTENGEKSFGLEAGSKAELLAVIALAGKLKKPATLICNGYKDKAYIELALMGQQLGHDVYIIVEKLNEIKLIIQLSEQLNITPQLGLRVRLASIKRGQWQNTGGEKGKFGLTANQVIDATNQLKENNLLTSLKLLHFHMGSQIANIKDLQKGLMEGACYYRELHKLGAKCHTIDIGGGLGIDYDGTRSRNLCSMNYNLAEYANNAVKVLSQHCEQFNLPEPNIITEAGRAMTAHHAVLITNIIDVDKPKTANKLTPPTDKQALILQDLWNNYNDNKKSLIEIYHNALFGFNEAQLLFSHGQINLQEKASAENYYLATLLKLKATLSPHVRAQQTIIDEINQKLAAKIVCNFSLFQSLPDVWAIDQLFPILPLSQLHTPLTEAATLHDMTCDSDGRIDHYICQQGIEPVIKLPSFDVKNPYLIGFFLIGAYQETLGDIHNLFGDTHSVDAIINKNASLEISTVKTGQTIADVLKCVDFNREFFENLLVEQLKNNNLTEKKQQEFLNYFKTTLNKYTYLN